MKFRKKFSFEAMQFTGENATEIANWAQGGWKEGGIWLRQAFEGGSMVFSLVLPDEGLVNIGDWVAHLRNGDLMRMGSKTLMDEYEQIEEKHAD